MKKVILISSLIACSFLSSEAQTTDKKITLKKVMSDPDWMGRPAQNWRWHYKSDKIIYSQKRLNSPIRDSFVDGIDAGDTPNQVDAHSLHTLSNRAVWNADKSKLIYLSNGNIFMRAVATGKLKQLTFTSESKTGLQFLSTGKIVFRSGWTYYSLNPDNFQLAELANLKIGKPPKSIKDPKSYVAKEQHKLIEYVAKKHAEKKAAKAHRDALKEAAPASLPDSIYLGKEVTIRWSSLSPTGDKMIVATREKGDAYNKKDVMPNYITGDASVEAVKARVRVGTTTPPKEKLWLLDLKSSTKLQLSIKDLDGFDEDVLASVKQENMQRDGKSYTSQNAPRNIVFWRALWSPNGADVAVMMEAHDNKDRWIATVDLSTAKFKQEHRLHDDAWINYHHNQMGWLPSSDQFFYQSEEDGYAHIYLKKPGQKTIQLTKGSYVADRITVTKKGDYLYYRANKEHPGVFEIYRVALASGKHEQLTSLGGLIDYRLSPDESSLLLEHSKTIMPPELFVQSAHSNSKAVQISAFTSEEFKSYSWQTPEIVEVKSDHHDRPIYARVYRPVAQHDAIKKRAVMFIHGAGYLQNAHKGWSGYFREFMFHQMLIQKGYVVMDMDWRASKGYGRDWRTAIYRQMGTPEVEDIRSGINFMIENENVDPKRIGGYGGSYGGFLTLMAMFKEPDLFAAGSALRLVSDWTSYNHGYTSNILNTPQVDPIAFERSSPIYFAEGLQKPLLLNAPMVDSNVFFQDTVRLVQRLIELEKTDNFETAIFPVENHGFTEPSSWLDEYRRIFKLFENNL
ncbi:prolyl oligopeptidase family serine peptidase [Temperatibacter marinus]|uniref:Prolyl oligopeptidase family serine peptidase n=1 Tax=Temperatibacter marinus TaxID=1456591 RepID=A0AA52H9N0_9PROT|nr:prolyl oligopeptidase family serine peptidase [Temperatibacter marinus]WND02692.1 prolyl oligopeptidase family serine peptidase [Temperatibacter marinus]